MPMKRTSQNSGYTNFVESPKGEVRRILIPRASVNKGKKKGRALWPGPYRPGHPGKSGEPPDQEHSRDHKQSANQEEPDRRHVGKRLVPSAPHSRESQRRNQRPEQTAQDSHHDEEDIPLRSSHAAASSSSLPRIHPNRSASHGCMVPPSAVWRELRRMPRMRTSPIRRSPKFSTRPSPAVGYDVSVT